MNEATKPQPTKLPDRTATLLTCKACGKWAPVLTPEGHCVHCISWGWLPKAWGHKS